MMIDMHAHWKPSEVAEALRARTREPRIVRGTDGVEMLKAPRMADSPLAEAFNEAVVELARMDQQDVSVSVLSVLGSFCWIEAQPIDEALPLCRKVNDGLATICARHPGRFAAFAALPLTDMTAAAAEFEQSPTRRKFFNLHQRGRGQVETFAADSLFWLQARGLGAVGQKIGARDFAFDKDGMVGALPSDGVGHFAADARLLGENDSAAVAAQPFDRFAN